MTLTYSTKPDIGKPAPDFALPGTDGKTYSLEQFAEAPVLVVVFTCNHCPYAQAARTRIIELSEEYRNQGVAFVAVNPNDQTAYPEDSMEHMREERFGYPFPYLRDAEQTTARAYGAVCTPDIFVYDASRALAYHGRLDDNWQEPENVTSTDLQDALDALLAGTLPRTEQKPSMGCSIKWRRS
jgi:peroxiredoxin